MTLAMILIPGLTMVVLAFFVGSYLQGQMPEVMRQKARAQAQVNEVIERTERELYEGSVSAWMSANLSDARNAPEPTRIWPISEALRRSVLDGEDAANVASDGLKLRSAVIVSTRNFLHDRPLTRSDIQTVGDQAFTSSFELLDTDLTHFRQAIAQRAPLAVGNRVYAGLFPENPQEQPSHVIRFDLLRNPIDPIDLARIEIDLQPLQTLVLTIVGLGTLILLVTLLLALRRSIFKPLLKLDEGSRRVATGDYSVPIPDQGGNDEVARLIRTFNDMQREVRAYHLEMEARIEEAMERLRSQERSLQVAQRLASIGTLAAGLAHEINNPLGGMQNAVRRMLKNTSDERSRDYLELMQDGLNRIQDLMSRILDFSRKRDEQPSGFDVNEVVSKSLALVRYRFDEKHRLETQLSQELPLVFGQASALGQVVVNLVMNARDALSDDGGVVRVATGSDELWTTLTISDNGCGMDELTRQRMFDPFFTTKEQGKGTGLGMAIVHNIISGHGGSIDVESALGAGTTICLRLPIFDATASSQSSASSEGVTHAP